MRIDLKKRIGTKDGKIPFEGSADLSGECIFGEYPFKSAVPYNGEIVNHLGVMKLSGEISATLHTHCARCLKPLEVPVSAQVEVILSTEESDDEQVFQLTEDAIEVEDVLIPELLLQIQMTYLCKDDCKGLCPICGADRNTNPCKCESQKIDPRLAKLASLLNGK